MKKVLLTYFIPFLDIKGNSSEEVAKRIEKANIDKLELSVSYTKDFPLVLKKLEEEYDYIVMLGQARGREKITIEERAVNLTNNKSPDNDGFYPNEEIIEGGCHYLYSNVDVNSIVRTVDLEDVKASHNAGYYVCNFLYYNVLNYIKDKNIKAIFIHLPSYTNQTNDKNIPSLDIECMVESVERIIDVLIQKY